MLTRRQVLALAWPIVLAQMATSVTGVVDTAVMGRTGTAEDLGAVAIAAVSFTFIYWGFGFLRMATTGQTAQALGADQPAEARAVLVRALGLAVALGVGVAALFPLLEGVALWAFQAEPAVEAGASAYMWARIPGAPAALAGFGVAGWLLGTGRTRELLAFQIVLNGVNAVLDATFVGVFGWGPAGIGAGTAIAEWVAAGFGLWLVRDGLRAPATLWDPDRLRAMFEANRDILVRTLAMLTGFAWFQNAGALVGSDSLAGNQVLLQFIAVSAFVLDSYAFVAEKEIGEAVGAADRGRLVHAMRVTAELALVSGAVFAVAFYAAGGPIVTWVIADEGARAEALRFVPFMAAVPLLGVPAWLLDGYFLGATRGVALRNAAIVATVLYVGTDLALRPALGNLGLWVAFLLMYVYRAGALGVAVPGLVRSVEPRPAT